MEVTVSDRPRQRVVIVGAGFAGFHAARSLARLSRLTKGAAELVVVNSTDYFLYLPLLPEVAGGILDPRRVSVLLAIGSVNKLLPIPGVAEHAHGFRSIAEALYLRDQLVRQIELADASEDPEEREARCTFVVVGAGYTGTEVAAQGQLFTKEAARHRPGLREQRLRWLLVDLAPRVLPELDPRLSRTADRTLSKRGMEIRTGTSVKEATSEGVLLSDGEFVRTRSLVWCVGVRPDPLVERLGLPTERGRLLVNEYLNVPDHPELFACGDAAANPFGVPLSGLPAKAVTRGYHLLTIPANRPRIAADWVLDALLSRQTVQLGLVRRSAVPLAVETPAPPER